MAHMGCKVPRPSLPEDAFEGYACTIGRKDKPAAVPVGRPLANAADHDLLLLERKMRRSSGCDG